MVGFVVQFVLAVLLTLLAALVIIRAVEGKHHGNSWDDFEE